MSKNEFVGFGVFGCDFMGMTKAGQRVCDELDQLNGVIEAAQAPLKLRIKQLQNELTQTKIGNSERWTKLTEQRGTAQNENKRLMKILSDIQLALEEALDNESI